MAHDKISNGKAVVILSQNRKKKCLEEHVHITFLIPWIVFVGHTRLPKSVKSLQKTLYKERSVLIFVSMIHFSCMPHRELGWFYLKVIGAWKIPSESISMMSMKFLEGQKNLICNRIFLPYDLSHFLWRYQQSIIKLLRKNQFLKLSDSTADLIFCCSRDSIGMLALDSEGLFHAPITLS